jgi:tRNA (Thr-GGU) A37 N-methylase
LKETDIITYKVIGYIKTPFKEKKGIPIQSSFSDARGSIKLFSEYAEGLSDLTGFAHIILIYHFHKVSGYKLKVIPFLDKEKR